MTPSDLQSIASAVYGSRWQSALARDMGIAIRTVQRWAADGIGKPATAEGVRRYLEERRRARIPAPPHGTTDSDNRDDAADDAIEPAVLALANSAIDAGWHPVEVWVAILSVAGEHMRAAGGDAALRQALAAMIQELDGLCADGEG